MVDNSNSTVSVHLPQKSMISLNLTKFYNCYPILGTLFFLLVHLITTITIWYWLVHLKVALSFWQLHAEQWPSVLFRRSSDRVAQSFIFRRRASNRIRKLSNTDTLCLDGRAKNWLTSRQREGTKIGRSRQSQTTVYVCFMASWSHPLRADGRWISGLPWNLIQSRAEHREQSDIIVFVGKSDEAKPKVTVSELIFAAVTRSRISSVRAAQ